MLFVNTNTCKASNRETPLIFIKLETKLIHDKAKLTVACVLIQDNHEIIKTTANQMNKNLKF